MQPSGQTRVPPVEISHASEAMNVNGFHVVHMPVTATWTRKPMMNTEPEPARQRVTRYSLALARVSLGAIFLWAFLDKTFGLGYSTPADRAWINGGSPTQGFLSNSSSWFANIFHAMAGNVVVDWLFMVGLLAIGTALLLGIGMRIAAASGALLMALMYLAAVPGVAGLTNPAVDDHVIYAFVLVALAAYGAGQTLGLGRAWTNTPLVQRHPILE